MGNLDSPLLLMSLEQCQKPWMSFSKEEAKLPDMKDIVETSNYLIKTIDNI